MAAGRGGSLKRADARVEVVTEFGGEANLRTDQVEVLHRLDVHLAFEILALMVMVDGFDALLEADGDEQADADGGDVDEEVAPGVSGLVGRVDVEHWGLCVVGSDRQGAR